MESKEGNQSAEATGSGAGIKLHVLATSARPTSAQNNNPQKGSVPEAQKIVSRNSNGTVVLTSTPNNEAELQLYRVMQRASLLAYYDTLLEMGGDDVQQLCDAGEEEFLEIMALVGMASKPLHVRRLQKALQEWVTNPALFQTPLSSSSPAIPETFPVARNNRSLATLTVSVGSTAMTSSNANANIPTPKEVILDSSSGVNQTVFESSKDAGHRGPSSSPVSRSQSPSSPQQTPAVLVQSQISNLAKVAERLIKSLPQFEPKPHNAKRKICKDLEIVMSMAENDPRRMDEIRKYASIYGRFDCKRNPQKPLTLHELSVNEAAAQICRLSPALLTRRDDLFALARQVVRDSGYNYSKTQPTSSQQSRCFSQFRSSEDGPLSKRQKLDSCSFPPSPRDSDSDRARRQERLEQIAEELRVLGDKTEELVQAAQQVRQANDVAAIRNLQQEMESVQNKQTQLLLEQSELLKQPLPMRFYRRGRPSASLNDSDKNDTDDNDSQFSLSNASSPSQEVGDSRDSLLRDAESYSSKSPNKAAEQVGPK